MKKIMANALILTMLGITLVYYAYTRHGGDFGASFGGSMLGGMTGSMIGSSMAAKSEPKTVIVQQPVQAQPPAITPAARAEGLSAEDVQENLDDLRRAFKKDLNTLSDHIDTVVSELRAENKEIKARLDACEANIKAAGKEIAQESVKEE